MVCRMPPCQPWLFYVRGDLLCPRIFMGFCTVRGLHCLRQRERVKESNKASEKVFSTTTYVAMSADIKEPRLSTAFCAEKRMSFFSSLFLFYSVVSEIKLVKLQHGRQWCWYDISYAATIMFVGQP